MWAVESWSASPSPAWGCAGEKFLGAALKDLPPPQWEVWGDFPASAGVHLLKGILLNHPCLRWLTPKAHKSASEEQPCLYLKCTEISHVWGLGGRGPEENSPWDTSPGSPSQTTAHFQWHKHSITCNHTYTKHVLQEENLAIHNYTRHSCILWCQVPCWTLKWDSPSWGEKAFLQVVCWSVCSTAENLNNGSLCSLQTTKSW